MGATGSLRLAFHQPTTFAALIVIAGRVEDGPNYSATESDIDRRANPFLAAAELRSTTRNMPAWITSG